MPIMKLNKFYKKKTIKRYKERYDEYGVSPKTLGWTKGKQDIRFDVLTSQWDLNGKVILDVGCGFGDLYSYLKNKRKLKVARYIGIDLVDDLVNEANKIFKGDEVPIFILGDFLENCQEIIEKYDIDYVFISGTFNFMLEKENNHTFVFNILEKAFKIANSGLACDFLSPNVDFKNDLNFHMDIPALYSFSTGLTRNIVIRHDYMPFEYALFLNKIDTFNENTVFDYYGNK